MCRPQRLAGKEEIMPLHVLHLYSFYYCGDTQKNRLEGKSLFKKFIDPSWLVFNASSSQRYCPSEYISNKLDLCGSLLKNNQPSAC